MQNVMEDELDYDPFARTPNRILVFMGKFDPPTIAHETLFRRLEATISPDVFLIVTTADTFNGETTKLPHKRRSELVGLSVVAASDAAPIFETLAAPNEEAGREIEGVTWRELADPTEYGRGASMFWGATGPARSYVNGLERIMQLPDLEFDMGYDELILAMGSDEMNKVIESPDFPVLKNMATLVWFPRDGEIVEEPSVRRLGIDNSDIEGVSSYAIRALLKHGKFPDETLLPKSLAISSVVPILGVYRLTR